MLIAVDFDGTIAENDYPRIGAPLPGAFEVMKRLQQAGHKLILWTCREDRAGKPHLTEAVEFCKRHGVEFYSVNANKQHDGGFGESFKEKPNRKIYADIYIDDRSLGGFPGWDHVERLLLPKKEAQMLAFVFQDF